MTLPSSEGSELREKLYEYRYPGTQQGIRLTDGHVDYIMHLLEAEVAKAEKAYGGCHKCYGKGYATTADGTIAYADFYGEKTTKSPITTKMKFCTCGRGKQLQSLLQSQSNNPDSLREEKHE